MGREGDSDGSNSAIAGGTGPDASAEPGIWRYAIADRLAVVIDGEDYFALVHTAMYNARDQIVLIGWDFDTRISLRRGEEWDNGDADRPARLGDYLPWLVKEHTDLDIRILKWGLSWVQFLKRGRMAYDIARMWMVDGISFRFDSHHPTGCSHHQKIAVFDRKLAVCGGIDLTYDRWDTREHLEDDPRRLNWPGSTHGPWHDITLMMEGPVAGALHDLCNTRWQVAGGDPLARPADNIRSPWPKPLKAGFEDVEVGLARTRAECGDVTEVNEIETLFLAHIARAKRFIYIENQYFTSRKIAEAIALRLSGENPPEIVIIHPKHADGWVEQQAMDHARDLVAEAVEAADGDEFFEIYVPYTGETPIYVHAKLMIVDDEVVRIGSANLNNRSMALDSECDVILDANRPHNTGRGLEEEIRSIRVSLLAEHCGVAEDAMAQALERHGTMQGAIGELGLEGSRRLVPYRPPEKNGVTRYLAESAMLDPERPDDLLRPFARGGLFRKGGLLARLRDRVKRKVKGRLKR
ncbi:MULTISPECIES: phospholipase D-like domain-containing protein [Citromicrobium]|uniref:phospholipase D-like domain-containing protein n=1 Tax=Citromicrobium TaxID=72173 RepID=UPI0001DD0ACE|nr:MULTISPECIES: phospholipase D-like domain-containing protein [Citromicrobium]